MIWRSVVGKLWLTIIGLVTLVLMLLSLILSEQLEKTVNQGQQKYLLNLARHIQESLQDEAKPESEYVSTILRVVELFDAHLIILGPDKSARSINGSPGSPEIPWQAILKETEIERVYQGKEVVLRGRVQVGKNENAFPLFKDEILLVAVPLKSNGKVTGAVVLYQEHDQLTETDIKRWIVYSALISIFLTTIFAFFLSTRITQPLIQMKRAAEKMAQGHFSIRVPIRQRERDEIGDLAISFNRMAEQLHESVEALSHEKEQLASILRSMVDGVITMDAEGRIIVVNPPAERLLASWSDEEEAEGSGSLPPPLREIFQTVVKDERDHAADITLHGRTWAVVMAPLYAGEQVRGAVAVLRDVTEERRLDKLRKDFVANVSHELRTPLSMLQGYSEALLDDIAQSPEARKELAQVIHDETLRMGRLVRDLLDLARMESGHIA
ncbi:MAG: histidine kinase dimerization/phospho-acceptor domain-containing protein, partial [Planifilum fimeticola]